MVLFLTAPGSHFFPQQLIKLNSKNLPYIYNMIALPHSAELPTAKSASAFSNTSANYKFYRLLAIIESVEQGKRHISKSKLFARMIANAWLTIDIKKSDLITKSFKTQKWKTPFLVLIILFICQTLYSQMENNIYELNALDTNFLTEDVRKIIDQNIQGKQTVFLGESVHSSGSDFLAKN